MLLAGLAAARTIELETTEVTRADVALSPDGRWLIFTILGHLFRLPVEGGTAEQLTFGPYYDSDPVGCAGKNSCKGKGGCAVPLEHEEKKEEKK